MTIALPFILELLKLSPVIAGAAQTLAGIFKHPQAVIVDSAGAPVSAAALSDLQTAAAAAMASAVTGVQAAG